MPMPTLPRWVRGIVLAPAAFIQDGRAGAGGIKKIFSIALRRDLSYNARD